MRRPRSDIAGAAPGAYRCLLPTYQEPFALSYAFFRSARMSLQARVVLLAGAALDAPAGTRFGRRYNLYLPETRIQSGFWSEGIGVTVIVGRTPMADGSRRGHPDQVQLTDRQMTNRSQVS